MSPGWPPLTGNMALKNHCSLVCPPLGNLAIYGHFLLTFSRDQKTRFLGLTTFGLYMARYKFMEQKLFRICPGHNVLKYTLKSLISFAKAKIV
jgi:hypothetical protein